MIAFSLLCAVLSCRVGLPLFASFNVYCGDTVKFAEARYNYVCVVVVVCQGPVGSQCYNTRNF